MTILLRRAGKDKSTCLALATHPILVDQVRLVRNERLNPRVFRGHDKLIRWGCTTALPQAYSEENTINTSEAIQQVNNKLEFRRTLEEHALCPKTWFSYRDIHYTETPTVFTDEIQELVVRPSMHSQGRNLHVTISKRELASICSRYGEGNYYISKLINKVAEYRVCVVSGRAIWVAKKTPGNPQDVAWNVDQGGRFDHVSWDNWPLKAVKKSIEAFNLSSLDFGGVDVMVDGDGECYILEINSAPTLTSPYRQECTAKALAYIIANGKQRFPLVDRRGGYKKFIHPAICPEAML